MNDYHLSECIMPKYVFLLVMGIAAALNAQVDTLSKPAEKNEVGENEQREMLSKATIENLRWITGCWELKEKSGKTEECWLAPESKIMIGMVRSSIRNKGVIYAFLRIQESELGIEYSTQPLGQAPNQFRLKEIGDHIAVFENPVFQFPQRIIYRMEGEDVLFVRAEGVQEGKKSIQDYRYKRIRQ